MKHKLSSTDKAIKNDRKPCWVHYSKKDPLFWRDEDGATTACGKTARRIRHTNLIVGVTCRRCIAALKEAV